MRPRNIHGDPLAHVVCPPNVHPHNIDEMNARMFLFHPGLAEERREDPKLRRALFAELCDGMSISEALRRLMELEEGDDKERT